MKSRMYRVEKSLVDGKTYKGFDKKIESAPTLVIGRFDGELEIWAIDARTREEFEKSLAELKRLYQDDYERFFDNGEYMLYRVFNWDEVVAG